MARKNSFPIDPEAGKITPLQNNEEKKYSVSMHVKNKDKCGM